VAGLAAAFGSGAMTNSIEELAQADVLFVIGSNTTEQHPLIGMRIIEAVQKNGAKLIVADPRKTKLTNFATINVHLKPGTNLAFIFGILNVIVTEGLANEEFIAARTEGYEEFKESIMEFTPERVEELTDIPADTIREVARTYAGAQNAAIVYAMGITQHMTGTANVTALANLALVTGQIGKPSSGVNPLRGQNNVQGACDMGALPNVYPGYQGLQDEAVVAKFAQKWGKDHAHGAGLTLPQMLEEASHGRMKAMYVMGENPIISDPDAEHVEEALANLELLIVQDIFMTETAEHAHVVLPAASFIEKDGTFTNTERRVQRVRKALEPIGEAKADWIILIELIRTFGQEANYSDPAEIMTEINALVPSYGGITYERLEGDGLQWPCPSIDHPGTKYLHEGKFPRGLGKFTPAEYRPSAEKVDEAYPLLLTTGRIQHHYHTGTMTRRSWALDREYPDGFIEIHPQDAETIGIGDGGKVRVLSRRGEIETTAVLTDRVVPGIVFMTFHFDDSPVNRLTSRNLDPVVGIPEYKVCAVRIEGV
jgi:formate dehydrogenase alpha subunit